MMYTVTAQGVSIVHIAGVYSSSATAILVAAEMARSEQDGYHAFTVYEYPLNTTFPFGTGVPTFEINGNTGDSFIETEILAGMTGEDKEREPKQIASFNTWDFKQNPLVESENNYWERGER